MAMIRTLLTALCLTLALGATGAFAEPPAWLEIYEKENTPSRLVFESWVQDIFNLSEIWIVQDLEKFIKLMRTSGMSEPLIGQLISGYVDIESIHEGTWTFYRRPQTAVSGAIQLSQDLKARIPKAALVKVYEHLYQKGFGPPSFYEPYEMDLSMRLTKEGFDYSLQDRLLQRVVYANGLYHVPMTPDVWPLFPLRFRRTTVTSLIRLQTKNEDPLSIQVIVTQEKISEIARTLAPEQPESLIAELQTRLKESGTSSLKVKLQDLLSPFIRKMTDQFHVEVGPNCFNCALNSNRGEDYFIKYESDGDVSEALRTKYIKLQSNERPQAGDVLFYYDERGRLTHGATLITEDIVFTKNGMDKFKPYQFQWKSSMERSYFPDNKFELQIFRLKPKSLTCTQALTSFF